MDQWGNGYRLDTPYGRYMQTQPTPNIPLPRVNPQQQQQMKDEEAAVGNNNNTESNKQMQACCLFTSCQKIQRQQQLSPLEPQ